MKSYPHMCRTDHVEIGHSDSEHERCPLCRMTSERDEAIDLLLQVRQAVVDANVLQQRKYLELGMAVNAVLERNRVTANDGETKHG